MSFIKYLIVFTISQLIINFPMAATIIITIIIACPILAYFLKIYEIDSKQKEKEAEEPEENSTDHEEQAKENREIVLGVLTKLGFQPEVREDGTIIFAIKDSNLMVDFGGPYVRIWHLYWLFVKANDPELPIIYMAFNEANNHFGPKIIFNSEPDEENDLAVHSRYDIMLCPQIPNTEGYIVQVIKTLFSIRDEAYSQYNKLSSDQSKLKQPRRPVGFAAEPETES